MYAGVPIEPPACVLLEISGGLTYFGGLEKLLARLDPNCQNLIRLKYLEERRDKDVIEGNLTRYASVDALKNQRSKCMKKLVDIAQNAPWLKAS